jgi:hypothetical protein
VKASHFSSRSSIERNQRSEAASDRVVSAQKIWLPARAIHRTKVSIDVTATLPAVSCTLVGDVADPVWIDTLRPTEFIVDRSTNSKAALD